VEQQHFSIEHANPSWFIPIVGNILVPVCGVHHFGEELSWFFFSIGAVFWLQLATVLLYRKIFHTPILEHLSPTFFILVAPPAVGFIAYTHLTAQVDSIARLLLFYGLFMTVLVLYLARRFLRIRFYLSFWAYSFPMAAITIAVLRYEAMTQQAWCRPVALLLYGLLTGIIVLLVVKTLVAVKNRTICMATH
jgi:tellurite resistance protein